MSGYKPFEWTWRTMRIPGSARDRRKVRRALARAGINIQSMPLIASRGSSLRTAGKGAIAIYVS